MDETIFEFALVQCNKSVPVYRMGEKVSFQSVSMSLTIYALETRT